MVTHVTAAAPALVVGPNPSVRYLEMATDGINGGIHRKLTELQQQMERDRSARSLGPDTLQGMRAELDAIEQNLIRNYTYFLPITRRRLKAQAGGLRRRVAPRAIDLDDPRALLQFHRLVVATIARSAL